MKTVLCIIIALLALVLYTKIISVLSMLEKKKEHIISETKLNNIDIQQESITLTNTYLALIIEVCRIEVSRHMASLKAINLKYDFLKLDEEHFPSSRAGEVRRVWFLHPGLWAAGPRWGSVCHGSQKPSSHWAL